MQNECPGLQGRNISVESLRCPKCGAEVEIFSDETSTKCQKCGERVTREKATPYVRSLKKD